MSVRKVTIGVNRRARHGAKQPRLIKQSWADEADQLADWAIRTLVNRTDAYGQYKSLATRRVGESNNFTAPAKKHKRVEGVLSHGLLARHFCGTDQGHLIGLHTTSKQNTSRWILIDVDQHGDDADSPANLRAALAWRRALRKLGFRPLLLDSNGAGGFHLLVVFQAPITAEVAYNFARWLVRDFADHGLRGVPETFPKQSGINEGRPYGNWARLAGRHHTRNHWTKVFHKDAWLRGQAAIKRLLATTGDSPDLIPAEARSFGALPIFKRTGAIQVGESANPWVQLLAGGGVGGRQDALIRLAGHYLGRGLDAEEVADLCSMWNAARNVPPLSEDEVQAKVAAICAKHASSHRPWRSRARSSKTKTLRLPK